MAEYIERTEELMLAMNAGARAIENTKRYHGAVYTNDVLSEASQEIPYLLAAKVLREVSDTPAADVSPVRHGRWILEAHDERANYRWNVTAECSECCDEQKEIWAGFFPNVPSPIARDVALVSAESVKLSNYCPNCGAKMDGGGGDAAD